MLGSASPSRSCTVLAEMCAWPETDASILVVSFTMVQRAPKSVHKWYGEERETHALVKLHVLGLT